MTDGRHEWDEAANNGEGESVFIPQEVCDATDRLSTRTGDWGAFRLLLLDYFCRWRDKGADEQRARRRASDEEDNRWRAEHGDGNAEFHTLDGGVFYAKMKVPRNGYYDRIWKRACRLKHAGIMATVTESSMQERARIRTYELARISDRGLPVYEEMES